MLSIERAGSSRATTPGSVDRSSPDPGRAPSHRGESDHPPRCLNVEHLPCVLEGGGLAGGPAVLPPGRAHFTVTPQDL